MNVEHTVNAQSYFKIKHINNPITNYGVIND